MARIVPNGLDWWTHLHNEAGKSAGTQSENYPKKEKGDKFGDKINDLGKIPPKIYSQGNGPVNARMGGFGFVGQCEYM